MLKPKFLTVIFLFIAILTSIWLYRDSFSSYFFQDDWFSFRISQANNINEFLQFFVPRNDVIYYRPLGMQVPFFLIQKLFGVKPFGFRMITIITHAINVVLVYCLIRLITKNRFISLLVSFLYSVSLVHYIPMYWSATYSFVLGPTFFLLTFITYLRKRYLFSLGSFIVGVLVNEIVIITPLILLLYQSFLTKDKRYTNIVPQFLVVGGYFLIRLLIFSAPVYGDYELSLSKHLFNNFYAYFLWSFNWPEEMKAQLLNFYSVNPDFIKGFSFYYFVFIWSLIISVLLFYFLPLVVKRFKFKKADLNLLLFTLLWFTTGLVPVLLFSKHSFSYYLPISLISLLTISCFLLAGLVAASQKKFPLVAYAIIIIISVSWVYTSKTSIDFNKVVHWAPKRAKIAEELIKGFSPKKFFVPDTSENRLSLNNQDAVKFLFGDDSEVIYGEVK